MQISADLFQQIVRQLKSDVHRDRDKRLEPRVGIGGEVAVLCDRSAERVQNDSLGTTPQRHPRKQLMMARVRDISRTGIGLYHSRRMLRDERFIVQLPTARGAPTWMVCSTCYCRRAEADRFLIGARIMQVLRPDQVPQTSIHQRHNDAAST